MHAPTRFARLVLCCAIAAAPALVVAQESGPAKPAVGTPQAPSQIYGKLLGLLDGSGLRAARKPWQQEQRAEEEFF